MLGGVAAWLRWRKRRQAAGKPFDKPNLVMSAGFQVVWAERFITAVSNSLRLEMAIFDGSCQLFYCTPTYSKKKGRSCLLYTS